MDVLEKAILFAVNAHGGQKRKLSETPYVLHPLEAGTVAGALTSDKEVIAACVLHDTVEDTPVTLNEIRAEFGDRVATLVGAETENKRVGQPPEQTWIIRKKESLKELAEATDKNVGIMWLADKLSNIRAIYRSFVQSGNAIFTVFHVNDKNAHAWYYRRVRDLLRKDFGDTTVFAEYCFLLEKVFGDIPEQPDLF